MRFSRRRERLALKIAPWLGRRYEPAWDEALEDLAEIAYGRRNAIWTSPCVLVDVALRNTREDAWKEKSRGKGSSE